MSDSVDPLKILTNDAEMASWNSEGLPSDRVSTENGTIVCNSSRFPLMIDPQLQGIAWIKERESKRDLQVTRLSNKNMITVFERSLESGNSVLVENRVRQSKQCWATLSVASCSKKAARCT